MTDLIYSRRVVAVAEVNAALVSGWQARPNDLAKVQRYAAAMRAGEFLWPGEPIVINDGAKVDGGNHRVAAVQEHGVSFRGAIVLYDICVLSQEVAPGRGWGAAVDQMIEELRAYFPNGPDRDLDVTGRFVSLLGSEGRRA